MGYEAYFERIVLAEKLREVRALVGFTRIESPRDFDSVEEFPQEKKAPLSRRQSTWVPACETRGEGIFFQFSEAAIQKWTTRTHKVDAEFRSAHERWRANRNLDPSIGYPGIRYVLLHSFAHALIRQLSIECGYTTASVAERIYCQEGSDGEPMAGVLIYTAAPDSEGRSAGCAHWASRRSSGVTSTKPWSGSACAPPIRSAQSTFPASTRAYTVRPVTPARSCPRLRASGGTSTSTGRCWCPRWSGPILPSLSDLWTAATIW